MCFVGTNGGEAMVIEGHDEAPTGTSSNEGRRPVVAWGDVVYGVGSSHSSANTRGGLE